MARGALRATRACLRAARHRPRAHDLPGVQLFGQTPALHRRRRRRPVLGREGLQGAGGEAQPMIAIDWGTSSLRCYRLDARANILESRASSYGILNVAPGQFPRVLEEQIAGWHETPIVMSGMVGSRQGWVEAPYVECPAGFDEIARGLKEVSWNKRRAWIVPGVLCRGAVPDVMRGEE